MADPAPQRGKPQLSAALLTVLTFIVIIGPLAALSAAFAAQVGDLLQMAQSTVADQTRNNVLDLTNVPWVADTLGWLDTTFGINVAQVRSWFTRARARRCSRWLRSAARCSSAPSAPSSASC